jgi:hypothetical protein
MRGDVEVANGLRYHDVEEGKLTTLAGLDIEEMSRGDGAHRVPGDGIGQSRIDCGRAVLRDQLGQSGSFVAEAGVTE